MLLIKKWITVFILAMLTLPTFAAEKFVLVENNQPMATIVIAKNRSKTIDFAVKELNDHIEKITGIRLRVATDDENIKGPRILVGESKATKALKIQSKDFKDQEYMVRISKDDLVLIGKDDFELPFQDVKENLWTDGKWGKGLSFDGSTVFTATNHGFEDAEGTLECWVRIDEGKPCRGTILRLTNGKDHVILLLDGRRFRYRSISGSGGESSLVSRELAPGWHHVAVTHSITSKQIQLIVNGVVCDSGDYNKTNVSKALLHIGGFFVSFSDKIWGPLEGVVLDDIRISREVRTAMLPGDPLNKDDSTTLLLPCDEGRNAPEGTTLCNDARLLSAIPDLSGNNGTLYAVYDFLETNCGVRWYTPGNSGTVFDKTDTLMVPACERRNIPSMSYREVNYSRTCPDYSKVDAVLFSHRLRARGMKFTQGNHSFYGFYERFSRRFAANPATIVADKPEFFAKGLTEKQMNAPNVPGGRPNLCYSSQELVDQVVGDIRDYFDGKGLKKGYRAKGNYFSLGPMDMAPYCKCAACTAAIHLPKNRIDRGMASDYWFGFINRIARELRKTHPDKFLSVLAYHDYANPPEKFTVEPNVAITFCALGPSMYWDPARRERDRRAFDNGWATESHKTCQLYVWIYYLAGMMGQTDADYPDACVFKIPEFMKKLYAAGVRGLFIQIAENSGYSPYCSQLELYLTMKLAFNRYLDSNAVIDEFFTRFYGASGKAMKQLYTEMEQVKFDPENYPESVQRGINYNSLSKKIVYQYLLTNERVKRWGSLMDEAVRQAQGIHKKRVQQYKAGVWDRMINSHSKYLTVTAPH